jgi:curli biogenesis system outer membrane secretion channel CsgG
MTSLTFWDRRHETAVAAYARVALVAALVVFGALIAIRGATAGPATVAAAQSADAGITACSSNSGKALYNCIANVLDRLSGEISDVQVPATRGALAAAASKLRAAVNKAQALSAISQCQAVISAALRQVGGRGNRGGSRAPGLDAIAGVLSHAAALIQTKG